MPPRSRRTSRPSVRRLTPANPALADKRRRRRGVVYVSKPPLASRPVPALQEVDAGWEDPGADPSPGADAPGLPASALVAPRVPADARSLTLPSRGQTEPIIDKETVYSALAASSPPLPAQTPLPAAPAQTPLPDSGSLSPSTGRLSEHAPAAGANSAEQPQGRYTRRGTLRMD